MDDDYGAGRGVDQPVANAAQQEAGKTTTWPRDPTTKWRSKRVVRPLWIGLILVLTAPLVRQIAPNSASAIRILPPTTRPSVHTGTWLPTAFFIVGNAVLAVNITLDAGENSESP